jgi:hypothetical protein
MKGAYCAGCCTNWSQLPSMEGDDEDEVYEYCPTCRTDCFLEELHDAPTITFNPITGEMIDDVTGIPIYIPMPAPPPVPEWFGQFDEGQYRKDKEKAEQVEDQAIIAYMNSLGQGEQSARSTYHKTIRQQ